MVEVDPAEFGAAMSRLATGVTVVTTVGPTGPDVMTANAVTSVSLNPTLLLVGVAKTAQWLTAVRSYGAFAVNVLAAGQSHLARWCASRERRQRPDVLMSHPVSVDPRTGLLLFDEALVRMQCRVHAEHVAGDHVLVLGEVDTVEHVNADAPLVFFDRGYTTVDAGDTYPLVAAR